MSLSEPEGAPIKGQQGCTPSGVFRAGCVSLPFSGFRGPPASRAHGPSCVFTAHHSCLCPCSHVLLSCLYFTRTRMITLNHAENPQQESPHLTILNFIMSAKSPPLLTKRRDSQGLGLGHGHLWGGGRYSVYLRGLLSSCFHAEDSGYCGVKITCCTWSRGSIMEQIPPTSSQGPFLPQCRHRVFAEAKSSIFKFCSLHLRPVPGLSL